MKNTKTVKHWNSDFTRREIRFFPLLAGGLERVAADLAI